MSRISQKPSVAAISPFLTANTVASNYTGTATPVVTTQAYGGIPATTAVVTAGTGAFDASFVTYVGQKFDTSDGRELVLVQNGAAALVSGTLIQSSAEVTAFEKLAMTVPTAYPATIGANQILVTNGSTVLKVNQFQQGYAIVSAGTGIGQTFKIASHAAAANAATFVVTLEDAVQVTLDATSKISLIANPYIGVITSPATTATGGPVGVAITAIAASTAATYDGTSGALTATGVAQYGLIACHGPVACLIDSTVTNVGYPLGVSKTTAGTLGVATLTTVPQVGVSMQTLTSAQVGMVNLFL